MLRAALIVVAVVAQGELAWADRDFTAAERRALSAGRLVRRPVHDSRSGLVGGVSWVVVDAPPDVLWRALLDFRAYRRFLPGSGRARLLQRNGAERIVGMVQGDSLAQARFAVRMVLAANRRELTFRVDKSRPHDLRDGWGFIHLQGRQDGRTLVAFGVLFDPGGPLLSLVVGPKVRRYALSIPLRLKRWVEGAGRERYSH